MRQTEEELALCKFDIPKNIEDNSLLRVNGEKIFGSFFNDLTTNWLNKYFGMKSNPNVLILSHNDSDGHGSSAAIAMMGYRKNIGKIYNIDGYRFDYSSIKKDLDDADIIYITDLSLQYDQLKYIHDNTKGLIVWIDHHESSISVDSVGDRIHKFVYSEIGISAATLCVIYMSIMGYIRYMLMREYTELDVNVLKKDKYIRFNQIQVPAIIRLISLYDTFHNDMSLEFQYGFQSIEHCINSDEGLLFWKQMIIPEHYEDAKVFIKENIVKPGTVIKQYVDTDFARIRGTQLQEVTFHIIENDKEYDCTAAILNTNNFSMAFGSHIEDNDICIRYYQTSKGDWSYGCYSSKIRSTTMNCEKFAKHFNGGGHKHAAGWSSKLNDVNKWINSVDKDGKITICI